MPEGDTIFRTARTLHRALAGKTITQFESVFPRLLRVDDDTPMRGRTVNGVTATGKHLVIEFSGDLFLHTHMRMNGSWHLYRAGERWGRPRSEMRVVIGTSDYVAVGFNVPVAEFHRGSAPDLSRLGPDILSDSFDEAEVLRLIRAQNEEEIANVLLDQRVIAGIGNIYKSESLHATGVNPFTRVSSLDDATLQRIVKQARRIMKRAATTSPARHSVYSRGGDPCRKCGLRIEYRKQGPDARGTYWCPKCQGRIGSDGTDQRDD